MPTVDETGRDVGTHGHQETGEVSDAFVVQHVDGGEDDHADQGDAQGEDDVEGALAEVVGGFGDAEEEDEADGVGGDGPEVGLDGRVAEAGDDLRQEIGSRREGDGVGEGDHAPWEEL